MNRPTRYEERPPRVLPAVATVRAGQTVSGCSLSIANRTASEPPGSSVAARKLLANRVQRLGVTSIENSRAREGLIKSFDLIRASSNFRDIQGGSPPCSKIR